jgi:uncharacterized repeat protein (TIGR03803 family)
MREKTPWSIRRRAATGAVTTLLLVCAACASTETVLYSFTGTDGSQPYAGLVFDASGNLFGTTWNGGAHGYGTVFELTPNSGGGWTETVLYSFCSATDCSDGSAPLAGVVFDAVGNLFGTTSAGKGPGCTQRDCGNVFELSPTSGGWTEKVIYSFTGSRDGSNPHGGVVFDGSGNLYGTTAFGGSRACRCGTIFELSPSSGDGWTESVIHTFQPNSSDGARPYAGLVFDADNNLYGTTLWGGIYGQGSVFRLKPKGKRWNFALLHSFVSDRKDGFSPLASVVLDDQGAIYGTTDNGGSDDYGTVFKLTPIKNRKWKETILKTFIHTDGAYPASPVILDKAGNVYGTTQGGGAGGSGNGGIVFKLIPSKKLWKETVLYDFCSLTGCSDGFGPVGGLIADKAGALYGTTAYGASSNDGVVFEVVF